MRALLLSVFLLSSVSFAQTQNHCAKFEGKGKIEELIKKLSKKLFYSYEEFCAHPRILDIYNEQRLVYHSEDDSYHPYEFITLHYAEQSCEYQYSLDHERWGDQVRYNTF